MQKRKILSPILVTVSSLALVALLATPARGASSLLHHWTFDTDMADSAGSHDGTATGDAILTTSSGGKFGGAVTLDGDGDYVQVGQASLPVNNFSLTAWIYRETAGGYMYIAGTQASGNDGAAAVPEPSAAGLMGLAGLVATFFRRRRLS